MSASVKNIINMRFHFMWTVGVRTQLKCSFKQVLGLVCDAHMVTHSKKPQSFSDINSKHKIFTRPLVEP